MGWLKGYDHDIFISYAHDDNQPQFGSPKGWVDFFEDPLRNMVQGMLGRTAEGERIRIFRDGRLRRFGGFDEQLAQSLTQSAVFVCVLSPNYLTSDWCKWELEEFLKLGWRDRILKVVLRPVAEDAQPAEIRRVLDTRFYRVNESKGLFNELRPQINREDVAEYALRLEELAQNIAELLKQLDRSQPVAEPGGRGNESRNSAKQSAGPPESNGAPKVVYLAETASDLAKERNDVRNELQQFNYRVLPDQPLPQDTEELIAAVRGHLTQADLSIHLLGKKYGARPDSEDRSIPHLQYDLAVELGVEQLIWISTDATPDTSQQQQFIDAVRKHSRDWHENKLEDFKSEVLKKLRSESRTEAESAETDSVNVCLFYHENDAQDIPPIYSHLTVEELFVVKLAREALSSPEQCKEALLASDAVLLYYGHSQSNWLVNLLRLIRRFTALRGSKPLIAQAIYSSVPQTEEKTLLMSDDPMVIHNYNGFTPLAIKPFVDRIRTAKGGLR